jgi:gluconolactonase
MKKPKVSFGPTGFPAFAGTMAVERVATGFRWAEGPVYFPAGRYVLFQRHSQQPHHALLGG